MIRILVEIHIHFLLVIFFHNLVNPYWRSILTFMHQHFHGKFLQFFMNNSWKRKCDKIKIILFDVSSCFTNQNSSFSWDFMVPVRILPPYCQKLFLRSRHLLDGTFYKKTIFHKHEKTSRLKKWFLQYGKNHFRVKMYPISQQLTKIFLIESHQENKQVKQKWDTKIQKQ